MQRLNFLFCFAYNRTMSILKVPKYLYPTVTILAIPAVLSKVYAAETVACKECHTKRLPKAKELPLYEKPKSIEAEISSYSPNSLEVQISSVRKKLEKYVAALDNFWKQATGIYDTGLAHSKSTYDYITQEENFIPRALTIASGGLLGLLLSARGGLFKKITYSSLGVTTVAAVCYPKEAKWCAQYSFNVAKEKSSSIIKEYTGYDAESISSNTQKKVGTLKSAINFENMTNTMKEWFSKVYPLEKMSKNKSKNEDYGQSNPEDVDMYSKRS